MVSTFPIKLSALPVPPPGPYEATRREYIHVHKWQGETVKVQCDARLAGFDTSKVKVVWTLHLRRLSYSGCNPKDPVMTLVGLAHNDSNSEEDQVYSHVSVGGGQVYSHVSVGGGPGVLSCECWRGTRFTLM